MKYEIFANLYFDSEVDAKNAYDLLVTIKDKMTNFINAGSRLETSEVKLLENNHEGDAFQPCIELESVRLDKNKVWEVKEATPVIN